MPFGHLWHFPNDDLPNGIEISCGFALPRVSAYWMTPADAAEILIEDILTHWRIEGLSRHHLEIIRGNLYRAHGDDIFIQWRALSTPAVERFQSLKLPPDVKDLKQLEELVGQYRRT